MIFSKVLENLFCKSRYLGIKKLGHKSTKKLHLLFFVVVLAGFNQRKCLKFHVYFTKQ